MHSKPSYWVNGADSPVAGRTSCSQMKRFLFECWKKTRIEVKGDIQNKGAREIFSTRWQGDIQSKVAVGEGDIQNKVAGRYSEQCGREIEQGGREIFRARWQGDIQSKVTES